MALGNSAIIRFMFMSDVTKFNLDKVNKELSLAKLNTTALTASFKLLQAGMAASIASVVGIALPFVMATSSVGELDRTLRLASSAAEDTRVYSDMIGVISDLSVSYGLAKDEIAGAVFEMAKAGIAFEDMAGLLEPSIQLATGNMMDMQEAMSTGIIMFNLFRDSGYDAAKMLSMLDKAATISLLDVQDLEQIVQQTGSAYAMAQVPMEQYLALMAAMSQEGVTMGARHGSIISQMLGREGEIEAIVGSTDLIEKGVLNLNMLMEYLRDIEAGSAEYQAILQVFGAGKGGKTFLDMMRASNGSYFEFTEEIVNATDEMQNKAQNMANSLPAVMSRIKEALTAPFANEEVITRINTALTSLLDTIQSPRYEAALAGIVTASASFITQNGPQMIGMLTNLLESYEGLFPTMETFARLAITILDVLSKMPPELLVIVAGVTVFSKALGPMIVMLKEVAVTSMVAKNNLVLMQMGLMGVAAGMMLAVSSGNKYVRYIGAIITAVMSFTTALWALNAAMAFTTAITPGMQWKIAAGVGAVGLVGGLAAASQYKEPEPYSMYQGGQPTQIPVGYTEGQNTNIGVYVNEQKIYEDNGENLERDLTASGVA